MAVIIFILVLIIVFLVLVLNNILIEKEKELKGYKSYKPYKSKYFTNLPSPVIQNIGSPHTRGINTVLARYPQLDEKLFDPAIKKLKDYCTIYLAYDCSIEKACLPPEIKMSYPWNLTEIVNNKKYSKQYLYSWTLDDVFPKTPIVIESDKDFQDLMIYYQLLNTFDGFNEH